jgi:Zn-finger nucleic acid-binding protein
MDAWESQGLALDHCPSCKGLWFDAGELGQHLAHSNAILDEQALEPEGATPFPCPRCDGARLAQVRIGGTVLDACPRCRGIFVDLGEIHELIGALERPEFARDARLAGFDNLALGLSIGAGLAAGAHDDGTH